MALLHELMPSSDDDDLLSNDDNITGEDVLDYTDQPEDTEIDVQRKRKNREAARRVRMKKNRKHEDVKLEFFKLSAENTKLKYLVHQEEKHLEKWIQLAEYHRQLCPTGFKYTLPGRSRPLILRPVQTSTVTVSASAVPTTSASMNFQTSSMEQMSNQVQPKRAINQHRSIIDIMHMNEGDIITGNKDSSENHEVVNLDSTPNWNLCVTSTEVGAVTMETDTSAIFSTATSTATMPSSHYNMYQVSPLRAPAYTEDYTMAVSAVPQKRTNILVEKLDSILGKASHSGPTSTITHASQSLLMPKEYAQLTNYTTHYMSQSSTAFGDSIISHTSCSGTLQSNENFCAHEANSTNVTHSTFVQPDIETFPTNETHFSNVTFPTNGAGFTNESSATSGTLNTHDAVSVDKFNYQSPNTISQNTLLNGIDMYDMNSLNIQVAQNNPETISQVEVSNLFPPSNYDGGVTRNFADEFLSSVDQNPQINEQTFLSQNIQNSNFSQTPTTTQYTVNPGSRLQHQQIAASSITSSKPVQVKMTQIDAGSKVAIPDWDALEPTHEEGTSPVIGKRSNTRNSNAPRPYKKRNRGNTLSKSIANNPLVGPQDPFSNQGLFYGNAGENVPYQHTNVVSQISTGHNTSEEEAIKNIEAHLMDTSQYENRNNQVSSIMNPVDEDDIQQLIAGSMQDTNDGEWSLQI